MAARIHLDHIEKTRQKIANSMLVNKLIDHVNGKIALSTSQVRAAEILIRKTIPDLSAITLSGDAKNPIALTPITDTDRNLITRYLTQKGKA